MSIIEVALLGVVQGLTEFLPVSSSGHLVIVQSLLADFDQPGVLFDVILHLGTTGAILIYFRKSLFNLIRKYFWALLIGSIPAVVVGLLFQDLIEGFFGSIRIVGYALLVTGVMNFVMDFFESRKEKMGVFKAFLVGVAQAIAIVPGISRSGSTIFVGTALGMNKKDAAEFSFILSIPAVLGASGLEVLTRGVDSGVPIWSYGVGFLMALVAGYFAIGMVYGALRKKNFKYFGFYCVILGVITLLV